MASLKWLVHSACHVLGYPTKEETNNSLMKAPCDNVAVGLSYKAGAACPNSSAFQMPLHYPRYAKADYESMEEWRLDLLLCQYGLSFEGSLDVKRDFAQGAFLWPDQY